MVMQGVEPETELPDTQLLTSRLRVGLLAWLGTGLLFSVGDLWLGSESSVAIQFARATNIFAAVAYFYLRRLRPRHEVERVAVILMLLGICVLGLSAAAAPNPSASLILSSVMVLGAATVLPWRFRCQVIAVSFGVPVLAFGVAYGRGDPISAVSEPMLAVFASFAASVYMAWVLEQQRAAANQATATMRGDAEVSSALARVGRELIASLNEPALLQRLCELTSEVFECNASYTFLIGEDGMLSAEAGHGFRPDEWETLRGLKISREDLEPLTKHLRRSSFTHWDFRGTTGAATDTVNPDNPVTMALYFALRKGEDLVGFQAAAYRGRGHTPTLYEAQMARGLSDLASLALESARLVKELEKANHRQNDFLANMSHELRTPLNVIIGYGDMILDGAFGDVNDEVRATIAHVNKTAEGQLGLITATLQLSQFESSDNPVDIYEVELKAFLEELERETQLISRSDSLEIVWDTPTELLSVRTDVVKLKMVVKNLIDNAIKFTDRGEVRIETRQDQDGVRFAIKDTGPGIADEAAEKIFEAFRQHSTPETQGRGGVGIGLYLVQRLLGALEGTIRFDSELGRGTTFEVWIPNDLGGETGLRESA